MSNKSPLSLLAYFFNSYPKQSLVVIGLLILAGAAETLGIGALLPLISMVIGGEDAQDNALAQLVTGFYHFIGVVPTLESLLITIVLTIIAKALIIFQAMRYVGYVAADVSRDMRFSLIKALMKAKWGYFIGLPLGKVANTISSEAQRAGHCYMLSSRTAAALVQSFVYIFAAFIISWQVSLLAVVMGGLVAFLVRGFIRMARTAGADMTKTTNDMLSRLNESLAGIKSLKAMAQEERYIDSLGKDTTAVMNAQKQQYRAALSLQIVHEPMAIILLSVGLYYVLTYTQTPVAFVILLAFLFYRLMTQVNLVQNFYQNMLQNEAAVWGMVDQIQAAKQKEEHLHSGREPTLKQGISINSLSIAYNDMDTVFDNFSDEIPANKLTVLFGPSGVGKTTLIDTVLGLINPDSGQILVDGQDLLSIDLRKWREGVGYVPQDTFLFHDTIMQNVTLGDERFSEDDVIEALKKAAVWEFVQNDPDGIKLIVGERGARLSGGQRQRIALARALIRKPSLLILDEATTGLDRDSEEKVFSSIEALSGKITVIAISHDPMILKRADHVIRLGRKEEPESIVS